MGRTKEIQNEVGKRARRSHRGCDRGDLVSWRDDRVGSGAVCKKAEQPCAEAQLYSLPLGFWGRLKTGTMAKIVGSKKTIECNISVIEGKLTETSEGMVQALGPMNRWEFNGCGAGCTVKTLGLEYTAHIWQDPATKGNGHMAWGPEEQGKAQPAIEVKCMFGPNCTFTAAEVQKPEGSPFEEEQVWVSAQITGGNPAFTSTVNQGGTQAKMVTTAGAMECGGTAELKIEYEMLLPKPFFVTHK